MWVKICGIRSMRAAVAAAEAGADAVGFIFAPGRRQVTPDRAQALIMGLPTAIDKLGVFVDTPPSEMNQIAAYAGLTAIQLHGTEPPEYLNQVHLPVIKAVRLRSAADLDGLVAYRRAAAILLEPYVEGSHGGTGRVLQWELAVQASAILRQAGVELAAAEEPLTPGRPRLVLAGGLTPQNLLEAIRVGRPGGVDVSSGVETDGEKDVDKIYHFIARAREVLL